MTKGVHNLLIITLSFVYALILRLDLFGFWTIVFSLAVFIGFDSLMPMSQNIFFYHCNYYQKVGYLLKLSWQSVISHNLKQLWGAAK